MVGNTRWALPKGWIVSRLLERKLRLRHGRTSASPMVSATQPGLLCCRNAPQAFPLWRGFRWLGKAES